MLLGKKKLEHAANLVALSPAHTTNTIESLYDAKTLVLCCNYSERMTRTNTRDECKHTKPTTTILCLFKDMGL